jgi:hypothetical protein
MLVCSVCKNEMGDLANFCNKCGTKLPPAPQSGATDASAFQKEKTVYVKEWSWEGDSFGVCGTMGHVLQWVVVNAHFCAICGGKIR